jgi:hypothetical protein
MSFLLLTEILQGPDIYMQSRELWGRYYSVIVYLPGYGIARCKYDQIMVLCICIAVNRWN